MKPTLPLRAVYLFFKTLFSSSIRLYFGKTEIINREGLDFDGPGIVVSNHPHTMFDPLLPGVNSPRYFYFLANYGMFQTWFTNWFFSTFFCIPIKRKMDNFDGNLKNEDSFNKAENHLAKDGVLYVAVEATSELPRRIRPIKTGTARIAFSAELQNDWNLGLTILPCGNNYEAPTRFRKKVVLVVGKPIRVADFRADFEKDPKTAVKKLSTVIGEKLSELTVDIPNMEDERALRFMDEIVETETGATGADFYLKRKKMADKFLALKTDTYDSIKSDALRYGNRLRAWRITDAVFKNPFISIAKVFTLLLTLPVFLWGALNNLFPYLLSKYLPAKFNQYAGYISTGRVMAGAFFMPLFYGLQTWLFHQYFQNGWWSLIYFLSLIPFGLFAWYWKEEVEEIFMKMAMKKISKSEEEKVANTVNLRNNLIEKLSLNFSVL